MRSKIEYTQTTGKDGKQKVERLGQADIQSDEMPYEFTVAADLDSQHQLTISKTRCRDLRIGQVFAPEHEIDMAATLLAWLQDAPEAAAAPERPPAGDSEGLTAQRMQAEQAEATSTRNGGQQPTPADEADDPPITLQHLLDTFELNRNQLVLFLRKEAKDDFGTLAPKDLDKLSAEQLANAAVYLAAAKQTAEAAS